MQIGETILKLRHEFGFTQKVLAEMLGVSFQTISKWERGLCCPDVELLPKLAEVLGVSTDTLLGHNPGEVRQSLYDSLYLGDDYYWGVEPTPFCYRVLPLIPTVHRPRLLEIGCGEGRDAVFFARNGCDVTAYDISVEGKRKTEQLAARSLVNVSVFCADMRTFVPRQTYDAVYASRALHYVPRELRPTFFERYKACTTPGGINAFLVIVDKPYITRAPDNDEQGDLMCSGELFTYYSDWEFLIFEEAVIDCSSSGIAHQHCINLMAAKKRLS